MKTCRWIDKKNDVKCYQKYFLLITWLAMNCMSMVVEKSPQWMYFRVITLLLQIKHWRDKKWLQRDFFSFTGCDIIFLPLLNILYCILSSQGYCFRFNIKRVQQNDRGCGKMSQKLDFQGHSCVFQIGVVIWLSAIFSETRMCVHAWVLCYRWILAVKEDKEKAEKWWESLSRCNVSKLMLCTNSQRDNFAP